MHTVKEISTGKTSSRSLYYMKRLISFYDIEIEVESQITVDTLVFIIFELHMKIQEIRELSRNGANEEVVELKLKELLEDSPKMVDLPVELY